MAASSIRKRVAPVVVILALGGCNAGVAPPPQASAAVAWGAVLSGPLGARLDDSDKQAAYNAQLEAAISGQRHSWRGGHGVFGFVEPAALSGDCRAFVETIYQNGRPETGRGLACKDPDGVWRMKD